LAVTPFVKTLVAALVVLVIAVAPPAIADPAPTPEEVQQAQARWSEGKAFFDRGNFEAARVAFKQAYTIVPHPAFLQNLGEAELRTGRAVDAARHFTLFLRSSSSGSPTQRELVKKSLKKASEKLGSLVIETNVDDAELRVDDEVVGQSPLGSFQWFVEPGRHTVTARREGYLEGSQTVEVQAGPSKSVFVRVQRVVSGASGGAVASGDGSGGASRRSETAERPASASPAPASDAEGATVEPRTLVLWSGAVLTAGALALGTVYAIKSGSDASHVSEELALVTSMGGCAMPRDVELCRSLADDTEGLQTDRRVRNVAFVSAGVLGAATVGAFFLWPPSGTRSVAATPSFVPQFRGVLLSGSF